MSEPDQPAFPLVTVIIPTIGRPEYMLEAVASALAQDYPNLEVLISDNLPKVATRSILPSDQLSRVRIVERAERLGFSAHFNSCLQDAKGEFVMFLSDDDLIEPAYVSSMVREMCGPYSVSVCFGQQVVVDAEFRAKDQKTPRIGEVRYLDAQKFFSSWLGRGGPALGIATFISMFARKVDLLETGGFREYPDGSHADNFLTISLALKGRLAVTKTKYYYRVYAASFGLGTPFEKLMAASKMFVADAGALLLKPSNGLSLFERLRIYIALRNMCALTMHWRLKSQYRRQMSGADFLWRELQILGFVVGL